MFKSYGFCFRTRNKMATTAQYEAVFDSMDADGSGQVNKSEMHAAMKARGFSDAQLEIGCHKGAKFL